ncbi:hypothetical protein INS49_001832 [Diaporthe citri]|uniref:uncharacterized protein n=1 Tax=Diaporthe citri TaxID=83186 RepID=UPI001C816309|nr:uncharacterized protein INS49_001832 [Diaporthe citri]KAG6367639.1 hypothetical protein INS49_001832 [Diaporthe citri]
MSREEGSGASGPQALGRTTTRVQPESAFDTSVPDPDIVGENTRRTRAGVTGAELRDRGVVEAEQYMAWKHMAGKRDEMLSPSEDGVGTGSSVDAQVGSSKTKSESNLVHDGAPDDAPNRVEDALDKFGVAPDGLNNAADGSNDGSSVAAKESNDVPDRYYDVAGSSNNAVDDFHDHVPTSLLTLSAHGGPGMDESITALNCSPYPPSLSEDTDITTTGLAGP